MKTAAKKAKAKPDPLEDPGTVAETHVHALDTGKQGYKTADNALDLLLAQMQKKPCPECGAPRFKNGGVVKTADGRKFRIRDKFAERPTLNVGMNARRYELELIP